MTLEAVIYLGAPWAFLGLWWALSTGWNPWEGYGDE